MKEPYYYELFPDELIKEREYRESFVTDVQFNEYFLNDLRKECRFKQVYEIKENIHKYDRLDYIYHLTFAVFSETSERPKYEMINFDGLNKEIQEILKLVWEYFYFSDYGQSKGVPLLPKPDNYINIIEDIEEEFIIDTNQENYYENVSQDLEQYSEMEKELILALEFEELSEDMSHENIFNNESREIHEMKSIKIGHIFKSNREACEFISIEYKDSTNSRKAQEKEFDRRWAWHRVGRTIVIDEIYPELKEKIESRGKSVGSRNNYKGVYAELVDDLILQYLQEKESNLTDTAKIYTTNNQIAEAIGIINYNYRKANANREKFYNVLKKYFDIESNSYCMSDVFDRIKTKIRDIVKSSLNRIKSSEMLDYDCCYLVNICNEVKEITEVRNAYEDEANAIVIAENVIMQEMGIEKKSEIERDKLKAKEFSGKVLERVKIDFKYIRSIYKGYCITLSEDIHQKSEVEIKELRKELNQLVINSLKERHIKNREKALIEEGLSEGFESRSSVQKKWNYDRLSKKYIDNGYRIIDILYNLDFESIVSQINNHVNNHINKSEESTDEMIKQLFEEGN
jgi:hypothetical protein